MDDVIFIGENQDGRYGDLKARIEETFAFREWLEGQDSLENLGALGAQVDTAADDIGTLKYLQSKYFQRLFIPSRSRRSVSVTPAPLCQNVGVPNCVPS